MAGSVIKKNRITPGDCAARPDYLFVFGDNMRHTGKAGQAIIRDEPNAVGIPTKHFPSMMSAAFFSDADLRSPLTSRAETKVKLAIDAAFDRLEKHLSEGGTVVVPADGVGTGLAELPRRAPAIYAYITERLTRLLRDER